MSSKLQRQLRNNPEFREAFKEELQKDLDRVKNWILTVDEPQKIYRFQGMAYAIETLLGKADGR